MRRKKIYCVALIFAVVSLAAFNMNIHSNKIKISNALNDNVEALAQESEDPPQCVPMI